MGHGNLLKHKGDLLKDLFGLFTRSPEEMEGQASKMGKPVSQPKSWSGVGLVTSLRSNSHQLHSFWTLLDLPAKPPVACYSFRTGSVGSDGGATVTVGWDGKLPTVCFVDFLGPSSGEHASDWLSLDLGLHSRWFSTAMRLSPGHMGQCVEAVVVVITGERLLPAPHPSQSQGCC